MPKFLANKEERTKRREEILKLRGEGQSYSAIGSALGISPSTVMYYCEGAKKGKPKRAYNKKIQMQTLQVPDHVQLPEESKFTFVVVTGTIKDIFNVIRGMT